MNDSNSSQKRQFAPKKLFSIFAGFVIVQAIAAIVQINIQKLAEVYFIDIILKNAWPVIILFPVFEYRIFWFLVGLILGGVGYSKFYKKNQMPQHSEENPTETYLKLRFFGELKCPEEISRKNIYSWYVQWSNSIEFTTYGIDGNKIENNNTPLIPTTWTIFVMFEKDIDLRQIKNSFNKPGLPQIEVKWSSGRSVVIYVNGDIPFGDLEITAEHLTK